jgi:hypothetical protein
MYTWLVVGLYRRGLFIRSRLRRLPDMVQAAVEQLIYLDSDDNTSVP